MLNRNFADATARIAAMHKPKFEAVQTPDLGMQFAQAMRAYQDKKEYDEQEANKTSLVEAIRGGNPEEIRAAAAKYDADLGLQYFMNDQAKAQDFERQKELLGLRNQYDTEAAEKRAALAEKIAQIRAGGNGLVNINMGSGEEAPTIDTAQMGLDTLQDIADRDSIGAWTRFRKGLKLTTDQEEKDLGAISSSIAAIAPEAISKLKAAGVSGINTMAEFLTYLGLPENPTSQEIAGALPQISAIIGKGGNTGGQQAQVNYKSKYGLD